MRKSLATSSILLATAASLTGNGAAQQLRPPPFAKEAEKLNRRIQEVFPTAKEKRFDENGWVKSLHEAERLAKEHNRPVSLLYNVGQMDIGRDRATARRGAVEYAVGVRSVP